MTIRRLLQIARKLTGHPERLGDRIAALDASFVTSGPDRREKIRPVNLGDRRRIRLFGGIHAANSITGKRAVRQENTANVTAQLQRDAWQYSRAVLPPCTAGALRAINWQYGLYCRLGHTAGAVLACPGWLLFWSLVSFYL